MEAVPNDFDRNQKSILDLFSFFSITRSRAIVVLLAASYIGVFASTYIAFTFDRYAYLGFGYHENWPASELTLFLLLAMLPSFWLPVSFERPSGMFLYFQYCLIYVPALWMLHHSSLPPVEFSNVVQISAALFVGMSVLLWAHHGWKLMRRPQFRINPTMFWGAIYACSLALVGYLALQLGGHFQLVSLAEIYILRGEARDLIAASGSQAATYAFFWTNGFLLPLIVARGMATSNRFVVLVAIATYIFLFGIWGSKATLFAPIILFGASVWGARSASRMPILLVLGLMSLQIVPALLPFDEGLGNLVKIWWVSIVNMRTFAIPGILLTQYSDFFSNHEWTLGSHVTGINLLVHYPYDYDIPRTVGYYFYGDLVTANANFWAQDGIAGFGLVGLVGMSFGVAIVLWLLDSVAEGLRIRFLVTGLSGILLGFANVSLFTTLLTGGLAFFGVVCVLMPRDRFISTDSLES